MSNLTQQTENHLLNHHSSFEEFTQIMIRTHKGRFDEIFWATLSKYTSERPELIVDLGTGPGLLLNDLRSAYPAAKLIGVEAQPVMIKEAQKITKESQLENFSLITHDLALENINGIEDNSVDTIIASMLLHELQVPTILINEMKRILKKDGVAVIYDWHKHSLSTYSGSTAPSTLEEFTHFSEHCRYDQEDLIFLFENSGFTILESMTRKRGKHIVLTVKK